jgi:hypothetical protein
MLGGSKQQQTEKFRNYDNTKCYRSRAEALAEVEREANVRFKCYDRWIADGRTSEVDATDRLERLISAWHYLADTDAAKEFELMQQQSDRENVTSTGDKTPGTPF